MTYTKKMTEGSELKHIILFTLPLFAGNVFQQLYNIVDSIIVGSSSARTSWRRSVPPVR